MISEDEELWLEFDGVVLVMTCWLAGGDGCLFGVGGVESLSSSSSCLDRFPPISPLVLLPRFLVWRCGGRGENRNTWRFWR